MIYIVLAALLYCGIGGFVCGLTGDDEMLLFLVCFWPIYVLGVTVIGIATLPYKLGKRLKQYFRYRNGAK